MAVNVAYFDRVTQAVDDLQSCLRYGEALRRLSAGTPYSAERTVYEALLLAFVIAYGRTFKSSRIAGNLAHDAQTKFGMLGATAKKDLNPPTLRRLHDRIMGLRDQAVAHSDLTAYDPRHYSDPTATISNNLLHPWDTTDVDLALDLVRQLAATVGTEHLRLSEALRGRAKTSAH